MITLKSKTGYVFTQSAEIPLEQRVYAKELYLAVNDTPGNWKEITDEEASSMQEELNKITKEEGNEY